MYYFRRRHLNHDTRAAREAVQIHYMRLVAPVGVPVLTIFFAASVWMCWLSFQAKSPEMYRQVTAAWNLMLITGVASIAMLLFLMIATAIRVRRAGL